MFCTHCGQVIFPGDKFCARCGTAAVAAASSSETSRVPLKPKSEVAPAPSEPPRVIRTSQSTVELFRHQPLNNPGSSPTRPEQERTQQHDMGLLERPPESREEETSMSVGKAPELEDTRPEVDRAFLGAEQLAAVRDLLPPDALQAEVPVMGSPTTAPADFAVAGRCANCDKANAETNRFCEACGTPLQQPQEVPTNEPAAGPGPRQATIGEIPSGAPADVTESDASSNTASESLPYVYDLPPEKPAHRGILVLAALVILAAIGGVGYLIWSSVTSSPGTAAQASSVEVTLTPSNVQVVAGDAADFAAAVTGSNSTDVNWSVREGPSGGRVVPRGARAGDGKVSLLAVYIAPQSPGTYHLIATSKADPKRSASAEITVTPRSR